VRHKDTIGFIYEHNVNGRDICLNSNINTSSKPRFEVSRIEFQDKVIQQMPVSQLPVAATHINLSTLSCDQIARPDPESGNYPNSNSGYVCVCGLTCSSAKGQSGSLGFFSCFGYFYSVSGLDFDFGDIRARMWLAIHLKGILLRDLRTQ